MTPLEARQAAVLDIEVEVYCVGTNELTPGWHRGLIAVWSEFPHIYATIRIEKQHPKHEDDYITHTLYGEDSIRDLLNFTQPKA